MIDLVLYAANKATLRDFAVARGLITTQVDEGVTTYTNQRDFTYCWWAGSGNFMLTKGTYDVEGVELTPPTFAAGVVALLRVATFDDVLDPGDTENPEQWHKSSIARYVRNNGTPGTFFGGAVPYYEIDGVRLMRPADVNTWLSANNLPGHEWSGGNAY